MATILDIVEARGGEWSLDDGTRRRTWAQEWDRILRVGAWLREIEGVPDGGHVAQLMGNRVEFVELASGASLAGLWITPVNWHLTAEEIAYVLDDSAARVVIVDPEFDAVAREAVAQLATPPKVVVAGPELDGVLAEVEPRPLEMSAPAGGSMFYTSGTTGVPKGVKRVAPSSVEAYLTAIRAPGRVLGMDGEGPHLVTGPLYHAAPIGFAAMDHHCGAPLVMMSRFDPDSTLDLIEAHKVRNSHLVPTMFVRLLRVDADRRARFDPSTLHTVLHGAAPIAPEVKRRMIEWWGPVLTEYWGASEGGVVTLVGSTEWLAHPGTVGRAVPGQRVYAAAEDGTPLPAGETGLLWCHNASAARVFEYHNAPDKTAAAHPEPHTYTIGDIGWVDEDGWVFLADRKSHMIISGGVNIYPAEVEKVLIDHPAIADVAVFGIPDEEWGEQVKAAVELREGFTAGDDLADDILRYAREHLAAYKAPRSIDFETELPRHPTGKLYTRLLRDRYWAAHDRSI